MIRNYLCLTVVLLLFRVPTMAQKTLERLQVGDKVPDVVLRNIRNYKSTNARLSDFEGKFIILDFWNELCTVCIDALPKMQKFQDEFKDELQILMVTNHTIDKFKFLFKNSPTVKNTKLPMVFDNKDLHTYLFPHVGEPYHVFIDKNGIVKAMGSANFTDLENVKNFITGKPIKIPVKNEYLGNSEPGVSRLLFNNGSLLKYVLFFNKIDTKNQSDLQLITPGFGKFLIDSENPYYSMLMKSVYHLGNAYPGNRSFSDPKTGRVGGFSINSDLPGLFLEAYDLPLTTKVIIDVKDGGSKYYHPGTQAPTIDLERYLRNFTYTYEILIPNYNRDEYKKILKSDIERYFKLKGTLEVRPVQCLVLFRTSEVNKLATKGGAVIGGEKTDKGFVINNSYLSKWRSGLLQHLPEKDRPIFLDESHINWTQKVDFIVQSTVENLPALNQELAKYGLSLNEEIRELPVLVLYPNK